MNDIKLFFKYFLYYLLWYFAPSDRSDPYYYDNELYIDTEKEFRRDMYFRDVERLIRIAFSGLYVFLIVFMPGIFHSQTVLIVAVLVGIIVVMPLTQVLIFSIWSTFLKVKELKSQY